MISIVMDTLQKLVIIGMSYGLYSFYKETRIVSLL